MKSECVLQEGYVLGCRRNTEEKYEIDAIHQSTETCHVRYHVAIHSDGRCENEACCRESDNGESMPLPYTKQNTKMCKLRKHVNHLEEERHRLSSEQNKTESAHPCRQHPNKYEWTVQLVRRCERKRTSLPI